MSESFELLVIQRLDELQKGQTALFDAFSVHKETIVQHCVQCEAKINDKFKSLDIKQAEDHGKAVGMARLWGFAGSACTGILAGGWEVWRYLHPIAKTVTTLAK